MFRVVWLLACLAACRAHAVLPLGHAFVAPIVPYTHGYGGGASLGLNGHLGTLSQKLIGHGYASHGLDYAYGVHHILKRSPHLVPVDQFGSVKSGASVGYLSGVGHLGAIGHVAQVAPAAVSHQSRLDVRSSPTLVAPVLPLLNPVAGAPLVNAAPVIHTLAPFHYGRGYYGSAYSHLGRY